MRFVWEHNGADTLLYSVDCVGAYSRGENLDVAISKIQAEIASYSLWRNQNIDQDFEVEIVQEKNSSLQISDADSDVIFDSEKEPISQKEYEELKNKPVVLYGRTHEHTQALIDYICKNYKEVKITNIEDEKKLKALEIITSISKQTTHFRLIQRNMGNDKFNYYLAIDNCEYRLKDKEEFALLEEVLI